MRISNSFSEDEIQVLEFVTQTLLRGGDPRVRRRGCRQGRGFSRRHGRPSRPYPRP